MIEQMTTKSKTTKKKAARAVSSKKTVRVPDANQNAKRMMDHIIKRSEK